MYASTPPWDIGRAQPAIVELERAGRIGRRVIDCGCGTGENALFLASAGHDVVGVDAAPTPVAAARQKAAERKVQATFLLGDALRLTDLAGLGPPFDTAIDSALFHVFEDHERRRYAASLHAVLRPLATYHVLCFSEDEPGDWGPRRVTQGEIRETFSEGSGWRVDSIEPAEIALVIDPGRAFAWRASLTRL